MPISGGELTIGETLAELASEPQAQVTQQLNRAVAQPIRFNRLQRIDQIPTPAQPQQDTVMPPVLYVTYESEWEGVSAHRTLDKFTEERRVGVYELKEIKHLKLKRELV